MQAPLTQQQQINSSPTTTNQYPIDSNQVNQNHQNHHIVQEEPLSRFGVFKYLLRTKDGTYYPQRAQFHCIQCVAQALKPLTTCQTSRGQCQNHLKIQNTIQCENWREAQLYLDSDRVADFRFVKRREITQGTQTGSSDLLNLRDKKVLQYMEEKDQEIEKLIKERDQAWNKVTELDTQKKHLIDVYEDEHRKLEEKLNRVQQQLADKTQEANKLDFELHHLKQEVLYDIPARHQKELNFLHHNQAKELRRLNRVVDQLRSENVSLKSQLSDALQDETFLRKKHRLLQKEIEHSEKALEKCKKQHHGLKTRQAFYESFYTDHYSEESQSMLKPRISDETYCLIVTVQSGPELWSTLKPESVCAGMERYMLRVKQMISKYQCFQLDMRHCGDVIVLLFKEPTDAIQFSINLQSDLLQLNWSLDFLEDLENHPQLGLEQEMDQNRQDIVFRGLRVSIDGFLSDNYPQFQSNPSKDEYRMARGGENIVNPSFWEKLKVTDFEKDYSVPLQWGELENQFYKIQSKELQGRKYKIHTLTKPAHAEQMMKQKDQELSQCQGRFDKAKADSIKFLEDMEQKEQETQRENQTLRSEIKLLNQQLQALKNRLQGKEDDESEFLFRESKLGRLDSIHDLRTILKKQGPSKSQLNIEIEAQKILNEQLEKKKAEWNQLLLRGSVLLKMGEKTMEESGDKGKHLRIVSKFIKGSYKTRLEAANLNIQTLEVQLKDLKHLISQLEKTKEEQAVLIDQLKRQIEKNTLGSSNLKRQLKKLQNELNKANRTIEMLRDEKTDLEQKMKRLTSQMDWAYQKNFGDSQGSQIRFSPLFQDKRFILTNNCKTIEFTGNFEYYSCLGNVSFTSKTYKWRIELDKVTDRLYVGVCKQDFDVTKRVGDTPDSWALAVRSGRILHNGKYSKYHYKGAQQYVTIFLDMNRGFLAFGLDGEETGIAYSNLKEVLGSQGSLMSCVSLYHHGDRITCTSADAKG